MFCLFFCFLFVVWIVLYRQSTIIYSIDTQRVTFYPTQFINKTKKQKLTNIERENVDYFPLDGGIHSIQQQNIISDDVKMLPFYKPRIFYFGVTYKENHELAIAADSTWGKRVMPDGFPWYSDMLEPRLKNVTVITTKYGNDKNYLFFRIIKIWEHVIINFPGFDWYIQCWDDSYVIKERIEVIAGRYNPDKVIEIGALHNPMIDFLDGGALRLQSRGLMEEYERIIDQHPLTFKKGQEFLNRADDWTQSIFKRIYINNTIIKNNGAFNHCTLEWIPNGNKCTIKNYTTHDLTCRHKVVYTGQPFNVSKDVFEPFADIPATFHSVTKEGQYLIDKLLYQTKCN